MELKKLARVISDFSMLPVFILNLRDGLFETISVSSVKDEVFSIIDQRLLFSVAEQNRHSTGFRYVHSTELSLLFFRILEDVFVIMGPYYISVRESEKLIKAIEEKFSTRLSTQKKTTIVDSVRVKNSFFADAWKDIMCALVGVPDFELSDVREPYVEDPSHNSNVAAIMESRQIQSDVTLGYGFERKIREAIMNGDKDKLYELLLPEGDLDSYAAEVGHNIRYRFEENKFNTLKSSQTILNTIFRISAENAGLPPIYLHSISDGISRTINNQDGTEENYAFILEKMINSYCDAINRIGIKNRSYRVTRVQKYIITNLTDELSLETLAEVADASPQHLSRLFKKECGVTITQYIRTQRINEAKWLIAATDSPIIEIAESLGFSSQNYFCNVFKAETGMTPSQYKSKSELTRNTE